MKTKMARKETSYKTFEEYREKIYPKPFKYEIEEEEKDRGFSKKLIEHSKKELEKILSEK